MRQSYLLSNTLTNSVNFVFGDEFESRCVRHTLGCLLARVRGRSQLEYLSTENKDKHCAIVLGLIDSNISALNQLIEKWERAL